MTKHQENAHFFTIVDTPGLFDCVREADKRISNGKVQELLNECITKDITHIHAFAFVFSISSGMNQEDIQSMIFFQTNYPEFKKFSMLIVSHCEEKNAEERNNVIKELFQHPAVVKCKLREYFGLGVFFTGSFRSELRNDPNLHAATNQITNILKMREQLLDFLVSREETYNIHREPRTVLVPKVVLRRFSINTIFMIIMAVIFAFLAIIFALLAKC
ncbi:unnamed protein product [Rotaria socialis]|uniref:AIG1-type G domain-containing protein n=1 Tax=Rotaria socialis TaxID=392032 RepID=A0A820TEQ2_9BILA|nr:unnamed protein product [Rotaria socialis]CAF3421368.1 unnamed protein product [Rotaria socialis]CAF3477890.1 unnamed protein product [Rotaria socialis]CAF4468133.1 unnamed protein product [Rotaria socialis]CAF4539614.1 unnamed protein product [Rotaria socialis]